MFSCSDNYTSDLQNLQKSIRTCAELTKFDSDMCRTYKIRFGHVQNLQKSIRTCAELTKSVKILLKIRTNACAPSALYHNMFLSMVDICMDLPMLYQVDAVDALLTT